MEVETLIYYLHCALYHQQRVKQRNGIRQTSPPARNLPVFVVEQRLVGTSAANACRHLGAHVSHVGPLCEDVTSSTKPEVRNVSQRGRKKTEPWAQPTCTESW